MQTLTLETLMQFFQKLRVYVATVAYITIMFGVLCLALCGLPFYYLVPQLRDWYRYRVEWLWACSIDVVVARGILGLRVAYTDVPTGILQRPLFILGVHQQNILHGTIGRVVMRIAGSPVMIVAKQEVLFLIRGILQSLGLGVLINRSDSVQSRNALKEAIRAHPESALALYPEGTRADPTKIARHREKYGFTWLKNTVAPRRGGVWEVLSSFREIGLEPRIYFVSHKTVVPDWRYTELYRLVGTTVTVRAYDVSDRLLSCHTLEEVGEVLNDIFRHENEWREWEV